VALSATPVSKIENLQTIIESLRTCKLEVRDEDDAEVKKYTHDKNIVEIIVEKEDAIRNLGVYLDKIIDLCLLFLKGAKLIPQTTQAKFVNKMTVLNL
jgi:ERCC4-related helicase